jgi:hypothetical protein
MKAKKEKTKKKKAKNALVVKKSNERLMAVEPTALYTSQETASYLRMKPQTLEVWRCSGRNTDLKPTKIGGRIMYLGADILAFVQKTVAA